MALFSWQVSANTAVKINSVDHLASIIQVKEAKDDIDQWLSWLEKTHPDLSYTMPNVKQFYKNVELFKNSINTPISVQEFWREISVFNSQLSDGHTLVTLSNWRGLTKEHQQNSGELFPFEVAFNGSALVIGAKLGGQPSKLIGYTIKTINGDAIETILARLLKRAHGDSELQRKAVLERRFAIYYWLYYGDKEEFALELKKNNKTITLAVNGSLELPSTIKSTSSFEDLYQFSMLDNDTALLTIKSFNWTNREQYFNFMKSSFKTIKEQKLNHLVIDIRENGGGDDDMWMKGIMAYIADKPWRFASKYKKKVIEGRQSETEKLGEVIEGEVTTMNAVDSENPNKFSGEVSILMGPYTYSSSILFTNTIQDFGFGQLIGSSTGAKSGQTGGTQHFTFPHSKLLAVSPRFLLERPNGGGQLELVSLDIQIDYDKTIPSQLIDKLMELK